MKKHRGKWFQKAMAVFLAAVLVTRSQVYKTDDDVFKYYQFYVAETQKEFDEFYRSIKKLSLYDTGVVAKRVSRRF